MDGPNDHSAVVPIASTAAGTINASPTQSPTERNTSKLANAKHPIAIVRLVDIASVARAGSSSAGADSAHAMRYRNTPTPPASVSKIEREAHHERVDTDPLREPAGDTREESLLTTSGEEVGRARVIVHPAIVPRPTPCPTPAMSSGVPGCTGE